MLTVYVYNRVEIRADLLAQLVRQPTNSSFSLKTINVFDQYSVSRPEWTVQWERGPDDH
jgi:hypothetical protein